MGIPILAETLLVVGVLLAPGVTTSAYAGGSALGAVLAGSLRPPRSQLAPILVAAFALSGLPIMPFGILRAMWAAAGLALMRASWANVWR